MATHGSDGSMSQFVLSTFPGAGLLDRAFEETGYCVVRSPDPMWGGDIKSFHPPVGKFDGVIGGPPCKPFSQLAHMVKLNHQREPDKYHLAENLIPEFERVVREAAPTWFLMENVPAAPFPVIVDYALHSFVLNNRWMANTTAQNRERRFWFGIRGGQMIDLREFMDFAAFEPLEFEYAVLANGSTKTRAVKLNKGGKPKKEQRGAKTRTIAEMLALQGLPPDFLQDSPFTAKGKRELIGNGVPLPMGKQIAQAILQTVTPPAATILFERMVESLQ